MDDVTDKLTQLQAQIARLDERLTQETVDNERLARTLKTTRFLALAALLLGVVAPLAARWLPITFRTVRAREFIVQDANGKPRVQLLGDGDGGSIVMAGDAGEPRIALQTNQAENLLFLASRAEKPSTGIRLSASTGTTSITLKHQVAPADQGELTGFVQLESTAQDLGAIHVFSANEGRVSISGSVVGGSGPSVAVWPPKDPKEKKPASWATLGAGPLGPALELQREDGVHVGLAIYDGAQLHMNGAFETHASIDLSVLPDDTNMMLTKKDAFVSAGAGRTAWLTVQSGPDDRWASPSKPIAEKK